MSYQAFLLKCKQERCHCSGVTCCVQALQILLGHFPDTCQGVGHRSALLWTEGMLSWLPSLPETKPIKLRNSESLCRSLGVLQHQVRFTHLLIFPCILQMSQGTQGRVQPLPCQGLTRGTDAHADLSERHRISGTIPHSLQLAPWELLQTCQKLSSVAWAAPSCSEAPHSVTLSTALHSTKYIKTGTEVQQHH